MTKTTRERSNGTALFGMAEEALKSYEQVLRTGLKLQLEAAQWWGKALQQAAPTPEWEKCLADYTSSAGTVLPAAQKHVEEVLHLLEKNNRDCIELVRKATEAAQTSRLAESQAKWMEFWKSSAEAARSNAEALTAANAKIVGSCLEFVEKSRAAWPSGRAV